MENRLEQVPIADTFQGRSLLITGVTGFVGKVLLEKILRSCSGVSQIYVLVRETETKDHNQRVEELLGEKAFSRARRENPTSIFKVKAVSGDVTFPACGLSEEDFTEICKTVTVVLHCAASVRFDENIRRSVAVNVEGVKNIVELCHDLSLCEALVHVSTAYAFCNVEKVTEEKCTTGGVTPEELMNVCRILGDEELELLFEQLRSGLPSVYHFTKAVAEDLLYEKRGELPVFIVRPSIVTAAWKEPYPGWVDTYNGPSGLIAACGKGVVQSVFALPDIIADFIPVDVVANTIIMAARCLMICRLDSGVQLFVVNCTSNKANPLTWGQIENICLPLLFQYPSMHLYRYPGGSFKKWSLSHRTSMILNHMIPAYMAEAVTTLTLRPVKTIKLYHKIKTILNHLEYFTTNQFNFQCENFLIMMNRTVPTDIEKFPVDIRAMKWEDYFKDYVIGVRRYLLKEKDETIPDAIKRMNRVYYAQLAVDISMTCFVAWIMYRQKHHISRVLPKALNILVKMTDRMPEPVGKYLRLQW